MAESDGSETTGNRRKSEFLKRLSAGKTLCSEVNKAASNAKFLHMRRHNAFVTQLESAKQSMLVENGRAQKDMRKQLDAYKMRKRSIFRDRVLSQQLSEDDDDTDDPSLRQSQPHSATSQSSRGGRKSSVYSVSLVPPGGSGISSGMFPAILRVPMVASDDENIHSAIQRQLQLHMRRQENLHSQILRSRVHEFCHDLQNAHSGQHSFYVTSPKRRIAFSEGTKSARGRTLGATLQGNLKTALASVA